MKLNFNQFDDGGGDTVAVDNDRGEYSPINAPAKPLAPTPLAAMESGAIGAASMAAQSRTDSAYTAATRSPSALASKESGAIGAASIASQSGAYKEPGKGAGMKIAKVKTPVDKSKYDRSIKVSQGTVDSVKRAGAYGSQKNAKEGMPGYYGSSFNPKAPASAEYKEAVKRVYPNAAKEPKAATPKAVPPSRTSPKNAEKKAEKPKSQSFSAIEKERIAAKPKIKVSQATVDAVKKDGKKTAQANAKTNVTSAQYQEAVRRVYPTKKLSKPEGVYTKRPSASKAGGSGTKQKVK